MWFLTWQYDALTNVTSVTPLTAMEVAQNVLHARSANITSDNQSPHKTAGVDYKIAADKYRFESDLKEIVPAIFRAMPGLKNLSVRATCDLVDRRGNKSELLCFNAEFTDANNAKINWQSMLNENIPLIADGYWQHPAFN